jgi:hypothetical protein
MFKQAVNLEKTPEHGFGRSRLSKDLPGRFAGRTWHRLPRAEKSAKGVLHCKDMAYFGTR